MRAIAKALRTLKEVLTKNKTLRFGLVYGLAGVVAMAAVMTGMRGLASSRQARLRGSSDRGAAEQ